MKICFEFPNKKRFNTKQDAESAVYLIEMAGRPPLRVYKCDTCKGWHLTSKPE